MKKNKQQIVFFYPSKIVGGAEYLFIRLAKLLAIRFHYNVQYIDYEDGFSRSSLGGTELISFIDFEDHKNFSLPNDSVVVTPLSNVIELISYTQSSFSKNIRVLLWSIQPYGLINAINAYQRLMFRKIKLSEYKSALTFFLQNKGLVFMDGPNVQVQRNNFGFEEVGIHYLPIPIEAPFLTNHSVLKENKGIINIGWVGRLSEEKIYSLINLLEHAHSFSKSQELVTINVHIIGTGSSASLIEFDKFRSKMDITLIDNLVDEGLRKYLSSHIDVLFAMGTSCLEGACMGIPTVLVDFDYKYIPVSNRFRYLFESENFSLADQYSEKNFYKHSFEQVIADVTSINNIGERCYHYTCIHHDIQKICNDLDNKLSQTRLSLNDIAKTEFKQFLNISNLLKIKRRFEKLWKKY